MKKPKFGAVIVVFVLVGLLLPAVLAIAVTKGMNVETEYLQNGTLVDCKVCEVATIGRGQQVKVKYKSADGQWIEADCIPNQRVSINQSLSGYVMPGDPYNVYCAPDAGLKLMIYAIIGAVALFGWVPFFMTLKEKRLYDKLVKNGVPYRAVLTSWHKEPQGIVGQFRVFTRSGEERIIDIVAQHGAPIVGESYDIILAEDAGGKIAAVLTDENLR